jgi:hypothetical protein
MPGTGGTPSTEGGTGGCPSVPPATGSEVFDGDLFIVSAADGEAAAKWSEITGSLRIEPTYPGVLSLPNLERVGGDVYLEGNAVAGMEESPWALITELRLPNLKSIGGQLFVYLTTQLVETDFRNLETVGYRVYYMRNLALRRIGLDALVVDGTAGVSIQASPVAASCEIEAICGGPGCGEQYSDADCTCEQRCDRLEPSCAAWD